MTASPDSSTASEAELGELATRFEAESPERILRAAAQRFPGKATFSTGFGAEGCVLVDLIARHELAIDVFTLDTGLLFPETYELWRRLEATYGLRIRGVRPPRTVDEQGVDEGPALWTRTPDRCCELRKVRPLEAELARFDAWITAIRRDQTADRAGARAFERDRKFGLVKVNPLVGWTTKDVWNHLARHRVPYNPLHDRGFPSIGCAPCTTALRPGEEPRAGRWRGLAKTECGLHRKES